MMTKHLTNNSITRKASQFENNNHDQSNNQQANPAKNVPPEADKNQQFITVAFKRFQSEFSSLYPDSPLPFEELDSLDQAKSALKLQQSKVLSLTKELSRTKFSAKFLEEIIAHNERSNFPTKSNQDDVNGDSATVKEQFVTVITLNESTYGEIKKQKQPPDSSKTKVDTKAKISEQPDDFKPEVIDDKLKSDIQAADHSKEKSEPIYSNTLENKKQTEKVGKKRPPTPPRKPKFNKLQSSSGDIHSSVMSQSLQKSDSYASISQIPRKFNGPVQQLNHDNQEYNIDDTDVKSTSNINLKPNFKRTFSVEPMSSSNDDLDDVKMDKFNTDSRLYKDHDNIYDTVAPDFDCDIFDCKNKSMKDDDMDTSSHEILSRSSSTEEGLSNYVNIDYFLRKNSIGLSNSNLNSKSSKKFESEQDDPEDTETNMSSIRSSDYDQFSSNENLLNSFQQQSTSLRSFNSMSTTSSHSGSSLRERKLPNDFSMTYPPNLSTFTPPIRETNTFTFTKESPLSDNEAFNNSSELNISSSSRNTSLNKSNNSSQAEYYAYTDILDSLPKGESKTDLNDEPVPLEDKSFGMVEECKSEDESLKIEIEHSRHMHCKIVKSIIASEAVYLDCLKTLVQYMNALNSAASNKDKALISVDELNTIFYRIPDLYQLHNTFLNELKIVEQSYKLQSTESAYVSKLMTKHSVGELFYSLAKNLSIYSDFFRNYSKALDTASQCGKNNSKFSEIIKSIKVHSLQGQFTNLVELLHKPIAWLQKNALVQYDLLKYSDCLKEDEKRMLQDAVKLTQNFLNDLNLEAARKLFSSQDKFKRILVKESFIVENVERRKLRHLFLFNDVIVCTKYKPSSKQKFTFELKWFQMLHDIVLDIPAEPPNLPLSANNSAHTLPYHSSTDTGNKEAKDGPMIFNLISNLKSRASALRYDIHLEEKRKGGSKMVDKLKKKLRELEAELVLYLPHLKFSFHVKNNPNKTFTFFLSSEYDRACWFETIKRMQSASSNNEQASIYQLQKWIESCRKSINPNLGSFLLRSQKDDTLCCGDLYLRVNHLQNSKNSELFVVIETDSYGYFFKRAISKYVTNDQYANINEEFLLELEGTQTLRFILYENETNDNSSECKTVVFKGKASVELTSPNVSKEFRPKTVQLSDYSLFIEMSYVSWNTILEKIPPNKIYGSFGVTISQVCKKEKNKVPYLIMSCINEVERRGLKEVGIYRVSGLSSDVQKLKKAFESNSREVCWLIREIDIHAVTGLLKLYLRELPESLFTNDMYKEYFEARDLKKIDEKDFKMTSLLSRLTEPNQSTVIYLIEHLVYVNRYEEFNKMSLNNLATIFGPTMLRTNSSGNNSNSKNSSSMSGSSNSQGNNSNTNPGISPLLINTDLFTASTIDVMAQADILYFFLRRKSEGFSLTSTEREETCL